MQFVRGHDSARTSVEAHVAAMLSVRVKKDKSREGYLFLKFSRVALYSKT